MLELVATVYEEIETIAGKEARAVFFELAAGCVVYFPISEKSEPEIYRRIGSRRVERLNYAFNGRGGIYFSKRDTPSGYYEDGHAFSGSERFKSKKERDECIYKKYLYLIDKKRRGLIPKTPAIPQIIADELNLTPYTVSNSITSERKKEKKLIK